MKRPARNDDNVRHLAATKLVARLRENHPDLDESTDEDLHRDLLKATSYSGSDGYEIAKNLDRQGWDCDASMVETLDGGCLDDAYDELLEKWIAWHAIKPKFPIGSKVTVTSSDKTAVGEIYDINMKRGTYTVRVVEWGHKMPGELGTQGLVFDWERIEAANVHPS